MGVFLVAQALAPIPETSGHTPKARWSLVLEECGCCGRVWLLKVARAFSYKIISCRE